jgi:hypothetical protein
MADVTGMGFRKYWRQKLSLLKSQYHDIMNKYPEVASIVQQVYKVLSDIELLAKCTLAEVGESSEWMTIVTILEGKPLFIALYVIYTVTFDELKAVLKVNAQAGLSGTVTETSLESAAHDDDFQEVNRRKRHICIDTLQTAKKSTVSAPNLPPAS